MGGPASQESASRVVFALFLWHPIPAQRAVKLYAIAQPLSFRLYQGARQRLLSAQSPQDRKIVCQATAISKAGLLKRLKCCVVLFGLALNHFFLFGFINECVFHFAHRIQQHLTVAGQVFAHHCIRPVSFSLPPATIQNRSQKIPGNIPERITLSYNIKPVR